MTISVTISVYIQICAFKSEIKSSLFVLWCDGCLSLCEFPNAQNGKGNPSAHMLKGQVPSST